MILFSNSMYMYNWLADLWDRDEKNDYIFLIITEIKSERLRLWIGHGNLKWQVTWNYFYSSFKLEQIIMFTGAASTTATDAGDHWVLNGTKVIHNVHSDTVSVVFKSIYCFVIITHCTYTTLHCTNKICNCINNDIQRKIFEY